MKRVLANLLASVVLVFGVIAGAGPEAKSLFKDKLITEKYADFVYSHMQTTLADAKALRASISLFTQTPSSESHEAAKKAWLAARKSYSMSETFRFYGGPIDDAEKGVEGFVNAWPIDEAYIDYVKGLPKSGIIADEKKFPKITKELLRSLNEKDGEKNISTGYHAVEFLLWGQDESFEAAGKRSHEDYMLAKNPLAQRRALYLNTLSEMLVDDLVKVTAEWEPTKGAYRKSFLELAPQEAATKILTGMTSLLADELSGERMMVALEKQDPENEQDCFSDNSIEDLLANLEGVKVTYQKSGLRDYFTQHDAKRSLKIQESFGKSEKTLQALERPFDKSISPQGTPAAKKKIQKAIDEVQLLSKEIARAALKQGIELNIETK